MRVLWFTNTPSLADKMLSDKKIPSSNWIKTLNSQLQNSVELHIAFYSNSKVNSFVYEKTTYHNIPLKSDFFIKKYYKILFNKLRLNIDLQEYLRIIDLVKPDVIHIHGSENPFGFIIKQTNIPVVISIQGIITVCAKKYFLGIEKKFSLQFGNLKNFLLGNNYLKHYNKFLKLEVYEKSTLAVAKYVIGRTDWDRRVSSVLSPNAKYFHNDEIMRSGFYHNKWDNTSRKGKLIIHTTTGSSFFKGFETIVETALLLLSLNVDFEWKIAGLKKEDLFVKVVCRKLGLKKFPENIIFLGICDEETLIENLLGSHIYIMPSHIENSPNSLCEAMLLGMPVIATHAGGTSSLLEDGKEGVLIQDGDPWSLCGAIMELNNDFNKAVMMGEAARTIARQRHDKTKIAGDLMDIYNTIIRGGYEQ